MPGTPDNPEPIEDPRAARNRAAAAAAWLDLAIDDSGGEELDYAEMLDQKPGDKIGLYYLVKKLGEGGFGIVWQAEQREPIKREVALKIIRPGMDTRAVLARFRAEQKALERMEHGNIAAVLDAGVTAQKLPFFVMELVRGEAITTFADQQKLDVRALVELFIDVCKAVQHAHQKGIMHRDLKPSNILVATQDGKAMPKVIDFGIAKALTDDVDGLGSLAKTAQGIVLGTPQYMAPEQAVLGGGDMDIRVDVFSLGAILYELLTGTPPMILNNASRTSVDKLLKRIHDEDPEQPSDRSRYRQAQNRTPPVPFWQIKGDLDWITLRALEKEADRRYGTANEMADDLQRYLSDEPVHAGKPGTWYRTQKLIRKHSTVFISAGIIAVMLILATAMSVYAFFREAAARQLAEDLRAEAVASQKTAEAESKKAASVAKFLSHLLDEAGELIDSGKNPEALRLALDQSVKQLEELEREPQLQAQLYDHLADVYKAMGDHQRALDLRHRQYDVMKVIYGESNPDTLRTQLQIVIGESGQGDIETAVSLCQEIVRRWEEQGQKGSGDWFEAVSQYATQLGRLGRHEEALAQMLAIRGFKNSRGTPANSNTSFLRRLAEIQAYNKDFDGARATLQRCLELAPRSKKKGLSSRENTLGSLSRLEAEQGHHAEAADYLEQSIAATVELSGAQYHPLIETWIELSRHYVFSKQFDKASKATDAALAIARVNGTDEKLPHALRACSEVRQDGNRLEDALPFRQECIEAQRQLKPESSLWLDDYLEYVKLLRDAGHLDEAEQSAFLMWKEVQNHPKTMEDGPFMRVAYKTLIDVAEHWQKAQQSHIHDKEIELWKTNLKTLDGVPDRPRKKTRLPIP